MTAPISIPRRSDVRPREVEEQEENDNLENIDNTWRGTIRPGTVLDVLDSANKWCEAEVIRILEQGRSPMVRLKFRPLPAYARRSDRGGLENSISINSRRIAKLHTHTYRREFCPKSGQRIEYRSSNRQWREAEICNLDQDQIQVGYVDDNGNWVENWIRADSNAIRPCSDSIDTQQMFGIEMNENDVPANVHQPASSGHSRFPSSGVLTERGRKRVTLSDRHTRAIDAASERYSMYLEALSKQGLFVQPINGDGNCLFRSASHQIYGDDKWHKLVRAKCMDYMESERHFFEPYVEGGSEGFTAYLNWKRQEAVWGDDPEVQAFCEIYDCTAEIWAYDAREGAKMLRTFHETGAHPLSTKIIRLSYYGGGHYDSLVSSDPTSNRSGRGLYPKVAPGEMEDRAIALSRARKMPRGVAAVSSEVTNIEEGHGASAEIVTESQLLTLGRSQFDAYPGMLDEALAVSLFLNDEEEAKKASEISSLQDEMFASAQHISEQEQIQAALRASVSEFAAPSGKTITEIISRSIAEVDKCSIESSKLNPSFATENFMDEEEALKEAMRLSVSDFGSPIKNNEKMHGKMGLVDDQLFNAELSAAREASIRESSGIFGTPGCSSTKDVDEDILMLQMILQQEEEEEELKLGLQKSLEKW